VDVRGCRWRGGGKGRADKGLIPVAVESHGQLQAVTYVAKVDHSDGQDCPLYGGGLMRIVVKEDWG